MFEGTDSMFNTKSFNTFFILQLYRGVRKARILKAVYFFADLRSLSPPVLMSNFHRDKLQIYYSKNTLRAHVVENDTQGY